MALSNNQFSNLEQQYLEMQQAQLSQASGWWSYIGSALGTSPFTGGLTVTTAPKPPSVDADLLDKLKAAEPRRVLAKMPNSIEPITAWRAWKVVNRKLVALGMSGTWEPKQIMTASCPKAGGFLDAAIGAYQQSDKHEAPHSDCSCGMWAFKDLERLVAAVNGNYEVKVLGQVSLWGRVIETENGYRAQYAYPKELWLFDNSLEELGYIYGVPVRTSLR